MSLPANLKNEEAVQATNDDAFSSKLAALHAGYFRDNFLTTLQAKARLPKPTRPPVINRGTFARVVLKRTLLQAFLSFPNCQIVSLGAGFDTTAFDTPAHRFVEIDLPRVVARKIHLAKEVYHAVYENVNIDEESVTAKRGSHSGVCHYALRSCDILNLASLSSALSSASVDPTLPTLILAEIVLVYLPSTQADNLISFLCNHFTKTRAVLLLEHTNVHDPFGETMARNIALRGCPLQSLSTYPTPEALVQRFRSAGFDDARAETMMQAFRKRFSTEQERGLQKVQLLDEVEEFELLLKHYVVLLAVAGDQHMQALERLELTRFQGNPFR